MAACDVLCTGVLTAVVWCAGVGGELLVAQPQISFHRIATGAVCPGVVVLVLEPAAGRSAGCFKVSPILNQSLKGSTRCLNYIWV